MDDWRVVYFNPYDSTAAFIAVSPARPRVAFNASIRGGPGVARNGIGGSTRREITRFDRPLVAAFSWSASLTDPVAVVRWSDTVNGELREHRIPLRR